MKENKIAGFWIRLVSKLFDVVVFASITILIAHFFLQRENGYLKFVEPWTFYVWAFLAILLLLLIFIIIPILFNGQSLGMFIFRLKIIFENPRKKFLTMIKRELAFSGIWIINLFFLIIFINHTLINKLAIEQKNVEYLNFEKIRIGVFTSVGSISFIIQWIFSFSIIVRSNKIGIHDKISSSKVVFKYRLVKISKSEPLSSFKPFMIKNAKVEWMEK